MNHTLLPPTLAADAPTDARRFIALPLAGLNDLMAIAQNSLPDMGKFLAAGPAFR